MSRRSRGWSVWHRVCARLAVRALLAGAVAWALTVVGTAGVGANQAQDEARAALAAALRTFDGVPASQCPAQNPGGRQCLALVSSLASVQRGVARFEVTFGPSRPGGYQAVFGRLADGRWGYWFTDLLQDADLTVLPGDVMACTGARGALTTALTVDGPLALTPSLVLRADRFVLTTVGTPGRGETRPAPGAGWYWLSAPVEGWVSSLEVTNAALGNCAARLASLPSGTRAILIESPRAEATVAPPFEVRGLVSQSPFESNLVYRLYDVRNRVVGQGPLTVAAQMGQAGSFAGTVTATGYQPGDARLEIEEPNMADGPAFAIASLGLVLGPPPAGQRPSPSVSGTVSYLPRIALPAGAVVNVTLEDTSRADAPAIPLGEQTTTTRGEQVPIPFEIAYDPARIVPNGRYTLRARITVDGTLRFINTTSYPVLTQGSPSRVEMILEPAR